MYKDWYAIKSETENSWLVSPKQYFDTYGRIPDTHANLDIVGMEEVSDHTYAEINIDSIDDGRQNMIAAGFEILENPNWYWLRYTTFECPNCMETVTSWCPGDHSGCPNDFSVIHKLVF